MSLAAILFLAKNRLAFTKQSFMSLVENTDWDLVDELHVYDDGSEDGTREWLERATKNTPVGGRFHLGWFGSPVLVMNDFLEISGDSPLVAKIDNDILMPPEWLSIGTGIFERQPRLECLGLEWWAFEGKTPYAGEPTDSTGGLILARRDAFPLDDLPVPEGDRGGLQKYQWKRGMRCAWIKPSIHVVPMDRIPVEPYASLNREYREKGWQRPWKDYEPHQARLWNWWRWRG